MKHKQDAKERFESLCNEQEALYKPEFEKVFEALYKIDATQKDIFNTQWWNMGASLSDEANTEAIKKALQKAGFADDADFCKSFVRYANIVIKGKKLIQSEQMKVLQAVQKQPEQKQKRVDGWNFVRLQVYASKELHGIITKKYSEDADEGKGLFANVTSIPLEDVDEDNFAMVDVFNCNSNLLPYFEDLKSYKVIGRGKSDAFLSYDMKHLLLAELKYLATYVKEHTDKPNQTKNEVRAKIKELDSIPIWGLFLQMLILQGLVSWLEGVNFKDEESSDYKAAQDFHNWLVNALSVKMVYFTYTPYSDKDKEHLKPLTDFLYHTDVGQIVQNFIFGEPQREVCKPLNTGKLQLLVRHLSDTNDLYKAMELIRTYFDGELGAVTDNGVMHQLYGAKIPFTKFVNTNNPDDLFPELARACIDEAKSLKPERQERVKHYITRFMEKWRNEPKPEPKEHPDNKPEDEPEQPTNTMLASIPEDKRQAIIKLLERLKCDGWITNTVSGYKWKDEATKGQIAYWVMKISQNFNLSNRASNYSDKMAIKWKPFEELFGFEKGYLRGAKADGQKYDTEFKPTGWEKIEPYTKSLD